LSVILGQRNGLVTLIAHCGRAERSVIGRITPLAKSRLATWESTNDAGLGAYESRRKMPVRCKRRSILGIPATPNVTVILLPRAPLILTVLLMRMQASCFPKGFTQTSRLNSVSPWEIASNCYYQAVRTGGSPIRIWHAGLQCHSAARFLREKRLRDALRCGRSHRYLVVTSWNLCRRIITTSSKKFCARPRRALA